MLEHFVLLILQAVWFFLPAGIANMMPVLAARFHWLPALARPLDGGIRLRGQRLLGENKTVRGVVVGLLFGSVTALIQYSLQDIPALLPLRVMLLTSPVAAMAWGAWLGFGALLGDALKSFLKRQAGIASGVSWKPFDQIDVVIGVLLVALPFITVSPAFIVTLFIIVAVLMYAVSFTGVLFRIKKSI